MEHAAKRLGLRRRGRSGRLGRLGLLGLSVLLLSAPHPVGLRAEEEAEAETKTAFARYFDPVYDALILRPSGFTVLVVGSLMLVPTAVLSSPGGRDPVNEAVETFFEVPFDYVFKRPLGEF